MLRGVYQLYETIIDRYQCSLSDILFSRNTEVFGGGVVCNTDIKPGPRHYNTSISAYNCITQWCLLPEEAAG